MLFPLDNCFTKRRRLHHQCMHNTTLFSFICLIQHFRKCFHKLITLSVVFASLSCTHYRLLCRNKKNLREVKILRPATPRTKGGVSHCARKTLYGLWRL